MKFLRVFGAIAALLLVTVACSALAAESIAPISQDPVEREEALNKALVIAEDMNYPMGGLQPTPQWLAEKLGFREYTGVVSSVISTDVYSVPQQAHLLDHLPPAGMQEYNDCAAFSMGYYAISYWNFKELGEEGTDDETKVGSSGYLYNQVCGGVDEGVYMVYPLRITRDSGCSFQADYTPADYVDLPDISIQEKALPQRTKDTSWFFLDANYPDPGDKLVSTEDMQLMKETLADGIPVLLGIPVYDSFAGLWEVEDGTVYYGPGNSGDDYRGHHAIIIAGYYDDPDFPGGGCFRLRNSWGEYWGFGGDIWVTYWFIRNYAIEAYRFNDFNNYSPSTYVVLDVGHPRRGDLDVDVKVDGTLVAWYSPWIFSYKDTRDDMEAVIDISDYVNSSTETIELVVSDKVSGFRGSVLDAELVQGGEVIDFRFDTGKVIPDDGETVGVISFESGDWGTGGDGGGGGCALPVSGMFLPMLLLPVVLLVRKW